MASKGRYSGSERLDPKTLQEPNQDNENTRQLWLEEIQEDPDFMAEIQEKTEKLKKSVQLTMDPADLTVHMVGQSHIDCAWLWRFEQTRQKGAITFRKAVEHAKMFPDSFHFALSEPLLLQWIKEDDPELFTDVQESVKAGNLELVGGSYVEADGMMPSGEAVVRERIYGMRFDLENFGLMPEVEWFPDSFGFNWGLPQILAKSGAKYFFTSKITWNKYTRFPFAYFWWESPDGTRILAVNQNMGLSAVGDWMMYEMGHRPIKEGGRKVWNYAIGYDDVDEHMDIDKIIPLATNFFGKGDGGHGPTHQEVAEANAYASLGFCKWSRVHDFYHELEKQAEDLPVWADELYLENHQGTFSVHAEVKRHNRLYENALADHESLALMTALSTDKFTYPGEDFEKLWITVLRDQFHDVLPGSSIPEVYDDCWDDWGNNEKALEKIRGSVGKAIASGVSKDASSVTFLLYNPVSWDRTSRVFIPLSIFAKAPKIDADGKPPYAKINLLSDPSVEFIAQPIAAEPEGTIERMPAGWWTVVDLKSVSSTPVKMSLLSADQAEELLSQSPMIASESEISNGIATVKVDPTTGAILSLIAPDVNGGSNLLQGDSSNLTFGFQDNDKEWPAWNVKAEYWKYPVELPNDVDVQINILENGPIFVTLGISRTLGISPVTQKVMVFAKCPEVFCDFLMDWQQPQVMLKTLYSTATNANSVIADIQYSAIERSTTPTTACDKARFEKICHKYFDLSTPEKDWGIALLNEGRYAFDATGGDMRLTMLRSPEYPGPAGESWCNKERVVNREKYQHEVPKYSGLGPFKCRYALFPHNGGGLVNADGTPNMVVKRHAEEFNQPILIVPAAGVVSNPDLLITSGASILEITTPNVFLGALKFNEWERNGEVIVRCVEGCGLSADAEVKFAPNFAQKVTAVKAVDLLERPIDAEFTWDAESGTLSWKMHKFEICTFAFSM